MSETPIRIYLDMNKWVDLARAYHGRADGAQYKDVLDCAKAAVQRGAAMFPLADVHILEARKNNDIERQRRLLTVMWELSGGWAIAPSAVQVKQQVEARIAQYFDLPAKPPLPVFGRGPVFAYGEVENLRVAVKGNEAELLRIQEYFATPQGLEAILARHADPKGLLADRIFQERLSDAAKEHQINRIVDRSMRRVEYVDQNLKHHPRVLAALAEFGVELVSFHNLGTDELLTFFAGIPFFDIEMELYSESDQNRSRVTAPNDIVDVSFFGVAIPECDIVVSERYWIEIARRKEVGDKYGAELLTNVNDLKTYLYP